MDDIGLLRAVEVLDVVDESALVEEGVGALAGSRVGFTRGCVLGIDLDVTAALVDEGDAQALVEERHLLEPGAQRLVVEFDGLEDVGARPERDRRSGLLDLALLQRRVGHAVVVPLAPDVALSTDLDVELRRQGVDDGCSDAVEAAGDRVTAASELAAGVQDREHDLDCGILLGRVDVDRDAAAVVDDSQSAIGQDRHIDVVGNSRQAPRRPRCRRSRRRGGAGRADRSSRCTCRDACEPLRVPRAPGCHRTISRRLLGLRGFGCHV